VYICQCGMYAKKAMDDPGNGLSAGQRLRDAIENEILTGALPPGRRLDEATLAARYGVSRTPIREALLQLAAANIVDWRPRHGAVVAAVTTERVVEMFEVMGELEGLAGRLAARRHSPGELERILVAHAACGRAAAAGDADGYYYENERFHHAIYAASRSAFLEEQCLALGRRLKPYRRLQLRVGDRMTASLGEHQRIVAAIAEGDGEAADAALRAHIVVQGARFVDLIASLGSAPL